MCGIAGIFAYGPDAPPADAASLAAMGAAMAARGPDGEGTWLGDDRAIGLAHRRLAVIDLTDGGAQPMQSADGRYQITFNGEIYNYRELRRELEAGGARFASQSDTEVLLHLYAAEGAAMLAKLRGMYAMAIWDRDRGGVFLARDPFGIKPLYYADRGGTLRFASQVKALLAGGGIDTGAEAAGHVGFFLWGHVPDPFTLYRGIRALDAGTSLWVDGSGPAQPERHFDLTAILAEAGEAAKSGAVAETDLAAALRDSVGHHLVADVPVGVFLSSGIDSTTLTALAAETGDGGLNTVTLGFDEYRGGEGDEVPLAEAVAGHCGTDHRTVWIGRADFEAERGRLMAAMDQPSIDGVNSYFVARAAAEGGLKVAMSGLGGDELFAGYESFRQIPALVRALSPFRCLPGLGGALRFVTAPWLGRFTSPKYAGIVEYGTGYGDAYLLRRGLFMPWELPGLLDPELVREGWGRLAAGDKLRRTIAGIRAPRLRVAALETCFYMRNQLLRDCDWAGMAHSLEIRVPLVDASLFRQLAPLLAGAAAPGKTELARSPARALPDKVLSRPKTGFSVPVRDWLMGTGTDTGERGLRRWARQVYAAQWAS